MSRLHIIAASLSASLLTGSAWAQSADVQSGLRVCERDMTDDRAHRSDFADLTARQGWRRPPAAHSSEIVSPDGRTMVAITQNRFEQSCTIRSSAVSLDELVSTVRRDLSRHPSLATIPATPFLGDVIHEFYYTPDKHRGAVVHVQVSQPPNQNPTVKFEYIVFDDEY